MNDTAHHGHTALVTGSIQGIGLAIAKAFASSGARVAVHGLATRQEAETAVAEVLAEKQPSLRTSDPSEIGAAALWLASPIAHNVTGIDLSIDGGWTVQ